MRKRLNKAFTILLSVVSVVLIIYYMLNPRLGALPFDDRWGKILAYLFIGCSSVSAIGIAIKDKIQTSILAFDRALLFFIAVSFLSLGCWMFGEKDRFAAQPVTRIDATITHVSGLNYVSLNYIYQVQGHEYTGEDDVDTWIKAPWRSHWYQVGDAIPIHYLNTQPEVSSLVQLNHPETYIAKGFFIVLGLGCMWGVYLANGERRQGRERDMERWLQQKNNLITPIVYQQLDKKPDDQNPT